MIYIIGENDLGVCFAGIGEPLERLEVIEDVVEKVRQKRHGVVMRVNTNGLFDVDIAERVSKLRLDKYTVSLASANPEQWREMVQPRCEINNNLGTWCAFVDTLTSNGARVEVTTVEAPNVDVQLARELAMSLGACEFRTREYFP
jgi:MoaA/NifB/PqqE/SkfB family radical SAM enzyme